MTKRGKKTLQASLLALALAAAGLLGAAGSASAQITFNPNPGGTPATGNVDLPITALDFGPGNAVAVDSIPFTVGATFQFYFQSHLQGVTGSPAVAGLNTDYQITEVSTFTERVQSVATNPDGSVNTIFSLVPSISNQTSIYYNPAVVFNDPAGTGFAVGTEIARFTATGFAGTGSTFLDTTASTGLQPINDSSANLTHTGHGSTQVNLVPTAYAAHPLGYDPAYFQPPTGVPLIISSIFNSNLALPFDVFPPTTNFTDPITSATFTPHPGAINGTTGPDFQLEVSGVTQSFTAAPVPEPASMTLMGIGVIVALIVVRRQRALVS
jgi:hypothetical protein